MAKGDTFFLRTTITSNGTNYVSDDIDISAYTDPARGRVLVVDKGFITFSTDAGGPVLAADIDSVIGNRTMGGMSSTGHAAFRAAQRSLQSALGGGV